MKKLIVVLCAMCVIASFAQAASFEMVSPTVISTLDKPDLETNHIPPRYKRVFDEMIAVFGQFIEFYMNYGPLPAVTVRGYLVSYRFPEKSDLKALTVFWSGESCSELYYHIAIEEDVKNPGVWRGEIRRITLRLALYHAGADFCRQRTMTFTYQDKTWTLQQLIQAFAQMDLMAGTPETARENIFKLREVTNPSFALARFIAQISDTDPVRQYGEYVDQALTELLFQNQLTDRYRPDEKS